MKTLPIILALCFAAQGHQQNSTEITCFGDLNGAVEPCRQILAQQNKSSTDQAVEDATKEFNEKIAKTFPRTHWVRSESGLSRGLICNETHVLLGSIRIYDTVYGAGGSTTTLWESEYFPEIIESEEIARTKLESAVDSRSCSPSPAPKK